MQTLTQELFQTLAQLPPEQEQRLVTEWLDELKWQLAQQDSADFLQMLETEIEADIQGGRISDLDDVLNT